MTEASLGAALPTDRERDMATISRLALELAHERADHAATKEALDSARRQARTWRRVSEWIFNSLKNGGTHGQHR